ncbi:MULTISPECIES: substrate-binding domain-containing protein [unclassified Nocardioides]|uniref:substrate-binding domain-containing protein n=1 Tax=unclassified Nocardioides TaxID=2615069 RepID=UPI0009F1326E|nr:MULTISPECIES: substrate-binding domain-containing protein [unclassified Nocardioides]GAW49009.1 phosphate ABC transporter, periplasmic phosphate-binding protein [Nocardioides sp. PD653-B2]GAW57219.1 phosphate ABC transporter, periplasmic phosphate-binding protein [Nocardioides sp. PD653]
MIRGVRALIAFALSLACIAVLPGTASATVYAQIEGTGSTWSELIVQQWIADVDANGMKVVYTGGGSTKGRKDFSQDSTDFAISEIPYQGTDERGQADTANGREFAYLPIVAGGTAFTYQLKVGNELVRNLRLSGETIAEIFTNQITSWDDPAISKDNNGRKFPKLPITPVVRSDGSGTTAQFTTWMDHEYPSIWRPYFGQSGLTSYYPKKNGTRMISQAGSDQVMNTIKGFSGNGMIGYVEYSYPINADYPVVKVLNKAGYYVEPTQYNTAVALTKAKINQDKTSQLYLTQILDGVYTNPDPRAYPISSYSYMIIPTGADDPRMSTAKRQTLADFMYYSLCSGQTKAGPYGYSPLPLNLVQAGFDQIAKLEKADPDVDLTDRDVTSCNNPTFDGKHLDKNLLAEIAPQSEACDKVGEGPCGTETGNNDPGAPGDGDTGTGDTGTGDTSSGGPGDGTGSDGGGGPGDAPTAIDPDTGLPVGGDTSATGGDAIYANPTTLVSDRTMDTEAFGWLAALELLALVLVPGLFVAALRRRRPARTGGRP